MVGRSRNIYCRVVTPFDIEVAVGIRETNVWIGHSRSLANVYRTVRLSPGDELHLLFDGCLDKVFESVARSSAESLYRGTLIASEPAHRAVQVHVGCVKELHAPPGNPISAAPVVDRLPAS